MSASAAIAALAKGHEPRTWSLIVTVFGDLARAPGAEVPGPVLSAVTGTLGIKPEAMRVALHRLRKDGWIATRKSGRVSYYRLTEAGRVESEEATTRIYATQPPAPDRWHLQVAGPMNAGAILTLDGALAAEGLVTLAPGVWLGPGPGTRRDELFYIAGDTVSVPGWLKAQILPPELATSYATFAEALAKAQAALSPGGAAAMSTLERAALRVLVVHGWRRLVLRHPALPEAFFPDDWAGPEARARVRALLDMLGRPRIAEIGHEAQDA